jgi:hypothetical protein
LADGDMDSRERKFLEESIKIQQEMSREKKKKVPGYLSNEIYKPVIKYQEKVKKNNQDKTNILDISLNEIIENTTERLNDFDSEFLHMLYKVDLKYGYSNEGNGIITNIIRYFLAFIFYLNDKNNILYIGITMLIISIILYFINIIINDKFTKNKS